LNSAESFGEPRSLNQGLSSKTELLHSRPPTAEVTVQLHGLIMLY
jgi:hypothetical protein